MKMRLPFSNALRRMTALFLALILLSTTLVSATGASLAYASEASIVVTGKLVSDFANSTLGDNPSSLSGPTAEPITDSEHNSGVEAFSAVEPTQSAENLLLATAPLSNEQIAMDLAEADEQEDFTYLSPDEPGVDNARIVAWPKEESTPKEIEETVLKIADDLDVVDDTEIIVNPSKSEKETLVILESDPVYAEDLINELMASGLYEEVDYDVLVEPMTNYLARPNDPYFSLGRSFSGSWGLNASPGANFSAVWARLNLAKGGPDTAPVAVIDTGFDMKVEDRGPNIVAGYDFGSLRTDVNPQSRLNLAYHGTGTAGVIAAATNNGKGIAGAAWDNKVIIYKATDADNALYLSAVTNSINDVVAKKNARIINLSLGGTAFPTYFQRSIDSAIASGILIVASSGNYGQSGNPVIYPAAYPPVLSVGSINSQGQWSSFASFNSQVDIAAPGENIAVLAKNSTYDYSSGTSFSAPHVSAAAALVWRAAPDLSAAQVQRIIVNSATRFDRQGKVSGSVGALNAQGAFETALGLPFQPKITSMSRGQGSVKINWLRDTLCSFPATGYVLQYRALNASNWISVPINSGASSSSYVVQNLKDNQPYYFRVATVNTNGQGPFSAPIASTTYPLSILSSKSTIRIQRGKTASVRIASHYCVKKNFKINWRSTKPKIATLLQGSKAPVKKGQGSLAMNSITSRNVAKQGKKITIMGLRKGTCYIDLSSSYASYRIKIVVY